MRWRLAVVTASFIGYFAFLHTSYYYPTEAIGVLTRARGDEVLVDSVVPGSRAAAAGFRPGDRIVSGLGLRVTNDYSFRVVSDNLPVGQPVLWQLLRDGRTVSATTAAAPRALINPGAIVFVSVAFGVSLILGLVVIWRRSNDTTSIIAGWFLAATGCAQSPYLPRSFAATWRGLPTPVGLLLWPACIASFGAALLLVALFARIRHPSIDSRKVAAALLPGVALLGYRVWWLGLDVYAPQQAVALPWPGWLRVALLATVVVYLAVTLLLAFDGMRRSANVTERRRIRVLVGGLAAGVCGFVVNAIATTRPVATPGTAAAFLAGSLAFCAVPTAFAYAMLRHRLFDFRVMVRLGLQYAIARGALLAAVPGSFALMVADVAWHNHESVRQIVADRGWVYVLLTVAALFAHAQRARWLGALDRRFFRERYAVQQVLHRIVSELATAPSLDAVGERVVEQIGVALHPRSGALLLRAPSGGVFEPLAWFGPPPLPLPAGSALAAIVRATHNPLVLEPDRRGLRGGLPREDLEWLSASGVELLVPVRTGGTAREILLALGPRRSEEPYSAEDIELLSTIAVSLAMVDRVDADTALSTRTVAPNPPPPLRGRYRIGRLLGHGGMGTVWEAHDEVLDRAVAIKFLRASDGLEQLDRFKHEAQLAARLNHPNVVVVHDYGSDDSGQPFLVMERLTGETLRRRLQRIGRLPLESAVALTHGVAAGVGAAHAVHLVHRDLKPENIFLCDAASGIVVKILDFGLARSLDSERITAVAGTPRYMAPEQTAGGVPTPLWDMWALGVIAYEMLAGVHPLVSPGAAVLAPSSLSGRVQSLRTHLPLAPAALDRFFERALAIDPAARPQSAGEFDREFAAALAAP